MGAREEIQATNKKFSAALAAKDATKIASLYTENATLLAAGAPRFDGRSAIEGFFKMAIDGGFTDLTLETQDVEEQGDVVIEVGRWTTSQAGGGDAGKSVVIWKREDGALKLHIDIFNSDTAPTP